MENKSILTMEEFLQEGEKTLQKLNQTAKSLKTTSDTLKWLYGGIIVILLALYMDTKVEVVKKADASEVEKNYMTKQNTLTVIKLSDEKNKDLIIRSFKGDTTLETSSYEWIRDAICNENFRGIE